MELISFLSDESINQINPWIILCIKWKVIEINACHKFRDPEVTPPDVLSNQQPKTRRQSVCKDREQQQILTAEKLEPETVSK